MTRTVCVSLGGSHVEVGVIDPLNGYHGSGSVNWRSTLRVTGSPAIPTAADLSTLIAHISRDLLGPRLTTNVDRLNVGIAFPGPNVDGRWHSNNLTDDFRNGVPVEQLLRAALASSFDRIRIGQVIAALDAQADAGGEVFHPDGALHGLAPEQGACVLNIATGVAAGFVIAPVDTRGQAFVIRTPDEFSAFTDGLYDNNAGHLGRHLIVDVEGVAWRYAYMPAGQLVPDGTRIRLSDVISGPALAARWAQLVINRKLAAHIPENEQSMWLLQRARHNRDARGMRGLRAHLGLAAQVRDTHKTVSAEVLEWTDRAMVDPSTPTRTRMSLYEFRDDVARNLGDALACWQNADGWRRFSSKIVLTGGVGQKVFRRTDTEFLRLLRTPLANGTELVRSTLEGGCERAAWFFDRGVFGSAVPGAP